MALGAARGWGVALVVLAKAYVQPDDRRWEPLVFVDTTGTACAVLALAHGEKVSEIINLAVDADHQRRGLGAEVVAAAIDRCRRLRATSMELTVNPSNEVAARLYRRVGFTSTDETRHGEPVWRLVFGNASKEP